MNIPDTTRVLAKCAALDQRTVGESDILAWAEVIPDWVEAEDALTGVTSHYRSTNKRLMPQDLIYWARKARARRTGSPFFDGDF